MKLATFDYVLIGLVVLSTLVGLMRGFFREAAVRRPRGAEMPFDAHMLLALAAPRPLYVSSASEDLWADPRGEFQAAVATSEAWQLLGKKGIATTAIPPADQPDGETVRYHLRTGKHDITAYDWQQYLDFAARHFRVNR